MLKSLLAVGLLVVCPSLAQAQAGEAFVVLEEFYNPNEIPFEGFGYDTAISGSRILVGESGYGSSFSNTARASIWEVDAQGHYFQVANLVPPGGALTSNYGTQVELLGDRAVVVESGSTFSSPAHVHVFERDGSGVWSWKSTAQTTFAAGGIRSMDFDGGRIVLGRNEAVDVFEPDANGAWFLTATIQAGTVSPGHEFGWSVSLDGDRIAVSAPYDSIAIGQTGRVDIFEVDPLGQWLEVGSFDGEFDLSDLFGFSIDLEGDRVIVGTHGNNQVPELAKVFVVERQANGSWAIVETLSDLGGVTSHAIKVEMVALSGDHAIARYTSKGNFWYTRRDDGSWVYSGEIRTPTAHAGVIKSLSLDGDRVAFGTRVGITALQAGTVVVFDLEPLSTDGDTLSLASGGVQTFDLEAGAANAGLVYLLVGSLSGTTPGFTLGGITVPLVIDGYFIETLNLGSGSLLQNSLGVLGPRGRGSASLVLPPGSSAALAGVVGHHAFACFDLQPLTLVFASNAQPLLLVQ